MMSPRCQLPPSFEEIAESAAFLVAVAEDLELGLGKRPASEEFRDGFAILKRQCEAAGLMANYPKRKGDRYGLLNAAAK
jgi:hypothetical protein